MVYRSTFCCLAVLAAVCGGGAWAQSETVSVDCQLGAKALGKDLYQMAVWVEDDGGRFLDTLYVTNATGKQGLGNSYISMLGINLRAVPEALPVWAYSRGVTYGKSVYPPKNKPLPDAITGATSSSDHFLKTSVLPEGLLSKEAGRKLVVCLEINVARDGVASMVFKAKLDPQAGKPAPLEFAGYGDDQGRNGKISAAGPAGANPADFIKSGSVKLDAKP